MAREVSTTPVNRIIGRLGRRSTVTAAPGILVRVRFLRQREYHRIERTSVAKAARLLAVGLAEQELSWQAATGLADGIGAVYQWIRAGADDRTPC